MCCERDNSSCRIVVFFGDIYLKQLLFLGWCLCLYTWQKLTWDQISELSVQTKGTFPLCYLLSPSSSQTFPVLQLAVPFTVGGKLLHENQRWYRGKQIPGRFLEKHQWWGRSGEIIVLKMQSFIAGQLHVTNNLCNEWASSPRVLPQTIIAHDLGRLRFKTFYQVTPHT